MLSYKSCSTDISDSFKSFDSALMPTNSSDDIGPSAKRSPRQQLFCAQDTTLTSASLAVSGHNMQQQLGSSQSLISSSSSAATLTSSHTYLGSDTGVVRESGSDLLVLKNPSETGQRISELRLHGQAIRQSGSDLLILPDPDVSLLSAKSPKHSTPVALRESGSDLLILANPSLSKVGHNLTQNNLESLHSQAKCRATAKGRLRRISSDIEILVDGSQRTGHSVPTENTEETSTEVITEDVESLDPPFSPSGSLTNRTVTAMVDHMYRSVYDDNDNTTLMVVGSQDRGGVVGFAVGDGVVGASQGKDDRKASIEDLRSSFPNIVSSSVDSDFHTLAEIESDTDSNENR